MRGSGSRLELLCMDDCSLFGALYWSYIADWKFLDHKIKQIWKSQECMCYRSRHRKIIIRNVLVFFVFLVLGLGITTDRCSIFCTQSAIVFLEKTKHTKQIKRKLNCGSQRQSHRLINNWRVIENKNCLWLIINSAPSASSHSGDFLIILAVAVLSIQGINNTKTEEISLVCDNDSMHLVLQENEYEWFKNIENLETQMR